MAELGGSRPVESIEKVHPKRISPHADGGMFNIVPDGESEPAGSIGVWWGEWQDTELWELGWMLLPQFHGRGLGSEALGLLIERLRAAPQFDVVHAFPGVSNGPSNGLCRKFGFELVDSGEVEFAGRPLVVNHWALTTSAASNDLDPMAARARGRGVTHLGQAGVGAAYSPVSSGISPACSDSRSPRRKCAARGASPPAGRWCRG